MKSNWVEAQALVFSKLEDLEREVEDLQRRVPQRNGALWLKVILSIYLILILGAWGYVQSISTIQQGRGERITAVEIQVRANSAGIQEIKEGLREERRR